VTSINSSQKNSASISSYAEPSPSRGVIFFIFVAEAGLFFAAWACAVWMKKDFYQLMTAGSGFINQFLLGLVLGSLSALIIGNLMKTTYFNSVVSIFSSISKEYNLQFRHWACISFLAGICEEPLFRGILQPAAGLYLSSFIFIALHGYFSFTNPRLTIFGIILYFISLMLGLLAIHYGMIAAVTAHAFFDFFIILILKNRILNKL
jgi:hypothetical protein